MKRLILFLVSVMAILIMGNKSLAAPSGSDLQQFYSDNYYSITGISTTESQWNTFVNSAMGYSSYDKYYMGVKKIDYAGTAWQILVIACSENQSVFIQNNSFSVSSGTMRVFYCQSNGATYSGYIDSATYAGGVQNWLNEVIVMDFSNIIYDPMIPTPDFSVTYTDYSSTLPRFPVEVSLKNASPNYYVEVVMENMTPSFVGVRPDGTYEALLYYQFASNYVYPMQGLTKSSDVTTQLLSGLLSSAWRNDINSYDPTSNSNFYIAMSDNETYASSLTYQAQCLKYNSLRQIGCFYGNNTGISIRYFRLDENNQVYAGKVRSWTNLYGGVFSESLPDYYKPYEEAQGYERDETEIVPIETATPDNVAPSNQYGKKTGLNININIGSKVPNYPDYPTIATYNLDNMLVSTIDNAKDIGTFFGGVTGFFQATLAFIPPIVWQVVAFGLALSVVVMFLKIL